MIFEWLDSRKVSPRAGGSMILKFWASREKSSILGLFWYLLFELLGSPTVENIVFKGAWILFTFYMDFFMHFRPPKWPPNHVKWRSIFGTIFYRSAGVVSGMIAVPSPPGTPLSFHSSIMQRPLRFAALPVIRHRALGTSGVSSSLPPKAS